MNPSVPDHPDDDTRNEGAAPVRPPGRLGKVTTIGTGQVTYFDGKGGVFDEHWNRLPSRPAQVRRFPTLTIGPKGGAA